MSHILIDRSVVEQALEHLICVVDEPVREAFRAALEQPQVQALSNEAIDKIIDANITTQNVHLRDAFYLCMRDVEVAHGIHETGDEE